MRSCYLMSRPATDILNKMACSNSMPAQASLTRYQHFLLSPAAEVYRLWQTYWIMARLPVLHGLFRYLRKPCPEAHAVLALRPAWHQEPMDMAPSGRKHFRILSCQSWNMLTVWQRIQLITERRTGWPRYVRPGLRLGSMSIQKA